MKYKIQKVQSVTGRTKILWVVRGVVRKVWHLPKWMSSQKHANWAKEYELRERVRRSING